MTSQQNFIGALSDSLTKGISSLVDADMNEESTRLQALQAQPDSAEAFAADEPLTNSSTASESMLLR